MEKERKAAASAASRASGPFDSLLRGQVVDCVVQVGVTFCVVLLMQLLDLS